MPFKDAISITKILIHLGEEVEAPKMQRARPPPEAYQVENEIEAYHEPELVKTRPRTIFVWEKAS